MCLFQLKRRRELFLPLLSLLPGLEQTGVPLSAAAMQADVLPSGGSQPWTACRP